MHHVRTQSRTNTETEVYTEVVVAYEVKEQDIQNDQANFAHADEILTAVLQKQTAKDFSFLNFQNFFYDSLYLNVTC